MLVAKYSIKVARTLIYVVLTGSWRDLQWPDSAATLIFVVALFYGALFCCEIVRNANPTLREDCLRLQDWQLQGVESYSFSGSHEVFCFQEPERLQKTTIRPYTRPGKSNPSL